VALAFLTTTASEPLTSATSITSVGIDTTGANLIVVGMVCAGTASDAATPVTDSKANAWTRIGTSAVNGGNRISLFYSVPTTVGTGHTVTYTIQSSTGLSIGVSCASGAAASPLDAGSNSTFAVNAAAQTLTTSPSVTLSQANELLVACAWNAAGGKVGTLAAGVGGATWTVDFDLENGAGQAFTFGHSIVSSTGPHSTTFSINGGVNSFLSVGMCSFKELAAIAASDITLPLDRRGGWASGWRR
jgi:hypothetical protein